MEARIAYHCVAAAHHGGVGGPDRLTIHEGKWAYCAFDALSDGHEWRSDPGLTLSMLEHSGAMRPGTDGKEPSPEHEQRTSQQR